MIRRLLPSLLVLGAVFLSACDDSDTAGDGGGDGGGTPCAVDTDCGTGRCGSGVCVECASAADCDGRLCVSGACVSCATSADCAAPTALCDAVTGACVGCLADTDCGGTDVCRDDRTCGPACASDADCADQPGTFCDLAGVNGAAATFTCVLPGTPDCANDGDCGQGEQCVEGACLCRSDRACADGESCVEGACVIVPDCASDADCAELGRVCERDGERFRCVPACAQDSDCGPFGVTCSAGHCQQQCAGDATCLEAGTICEGNFCVDAECVTASECPAGQLCSDERHGRCVTYTPCTTDAECGDPDFACGDPDPCPPGFDCAAIDVCYERAACVADGDCAAGQYCQNLHCRDASACTGRGDCAADQDCVAGICVPFVCRGDLDCADGEVCTAGLCGAPPLPTGVTEIRLLTQPRPLAAAEELQLVAIGVTASGVAIADLPFGWSSADPAIAGVDAVTGLLRAGATEGCTEVEVTLQVAARTLRDSATFCLFAPAPGDAQVIVFDATTGAPMPAATVVLDGVTATTGADGRASFPGMSAAGHGAVAVYAAGYDVVVLQDAVSDSIAVGLRPDRTGFAAGFSAEVSFDAVTSQGGLEVGLAGGSRDEITGLSLAQLVGDVFVQNLATPLGSFDVPVPGAMTLNLTSPFPIPIKETAYCTSDPDLRAVWSFAGRVDPASLGIGGGGGMPSAGQVIARLLPYFGTFEHGLQSETLPDAPLVPDGNDLDGDGNASELRADFLGAAFPSLRLRPSLLPALRVELTLPTPPSFEGTRLDTVLLVAAARAPRLGYVPLGLSAAVDEDGDGVLPNETLRLTPRYAGLEAGAWAMAALAVRLPAGQGTELPVELSARLASSDWLPQQVDLANAPFLPFAEGAAFDPVARTIALPIAIAADLAASGADVLRVRVRSDRGALVVYARAGASTVRVPPPPAGLEASDPLVPGAVVFVEPISITAESFDSLAEAGGATLSDLDSLADGYSRSLAR